MSLARVAGHPDYSSAGTNNFIPEIWSSKLVEKLYDVTVLGSISNTDYEGEIKDSGDTVIIRTLPTVTVNDYTKGMKLTYERLESASLSLLIDQGHYWAFTIDDVDAWQSDLALMDRWGEDAAMQLKKTIDTNILKYIFYPTNLCDSANKGSTAGRISSAYNLGVTATPVQFTANTALDLIVDAGSVLDEQNVSPEGRFIVLPAWAINKIKKSDIKDASLSGDGTSVLRNGRVGIIDRFTVYMSNLLYSLTDTVTCWHCPFGTKMALTFAQQIVKTESLRAETTFGDLVRGLVVYGRKIVQDAAIGDLYIKQ
jgi:hypothetical protein